MSRPDRATVAVDFAPPRPVKRTRPVIALVAAIALVAGIGLAVTQLLLR